MCKEGVIADNNATHLAIALEGDKDHPVRTQLGQYPSSRDIKDQVLQLIDSE